jgi:hypothetical protein
METISYMKDKPWYGKKSTTARIPIGHYHTLPMSKGNLYQAVRKLTGLPRSRFCELIRITEQQLRSRERTKRVYHMCEVVALQAVSGITWEEFGKLLNDIA